ncbi:MAG: universal stress protein [Syntrophales bacterium]|jgi:nucleotide-binding universal stress UspA family protein|nr:universal stress protein [Syntrophales bacterium]
MFAPKNILVPTDFSKYSDAALKKAIDIAEQYKAKIYLLHVIDEHVRQCAVDYCLDIGVVDRLEAESIKAAKDKLHKEAAAIGEAKKLKIVFDVKNGNPAEVILTEQQEKKIDLIVIASHGKTGLLKQLMGSVADKVVKGSKCPVIVVKP